MISGILNLVSKYLKEAKAVLALGAVGFGLAQMVGFLSIPIEYWVPGAFILGLCELEDHAEAKKAESKKKGH